jgi:hypothetical protein
VLDPVKKRCRTFAAGREVFPAATRGRLGWKRLPVNTSPPHLWPTCPPSSVSNADHLQISDAVGHCCWASDDRFVLARPDQRHRCRPGRVLAESAGE